MQTAALVIINAIISIVVLGVFCHSGFICAFKWFFYTWLLIGGVPIGWWVLWTALKSRRDDINTQSVKKVNNV